MCPREHQSLGDKCLQECYVLPKTILSLNRPSSLSPLLQHLVYTQLWIQGCELIWNVGTSSLLAFWRVFFSFPSRAADLVETYLLWYTPKWSIPYTFPIWNHFLCAHSEPILKSFLFALWKSLYFILVSNNLHNWLNKDNLTTNHSFGK